MSASGISFTANQQSTYVTIETVPQDPVFDSLTVQGPVIIPSFGDLVAKLTSIDSNIDLNEIDISNRVLTSTYTTGLSSKLDTASYNTSIANYYTKTDTNTLLNAKANVNNPSFTGVVTVPTHGDIVAKITSIDSAIAERATITSPTFSGTVTLPSIISTNTTCQIFNANNTISNRVSIGADIGTVQKVGIQLASELTTEFNMLVRRTATATTSLPMIGFQRGTTAVGSISTTSTATAYNTSSDYRLKDVIGEITDASTRILALKPICFSWKSTGEVVDGFLAHEAQEVVPQCVTGLKDAMNDDGTPNYQGIDQSKLVPLLTAAIQDALKRIAVLEAK